MTTVADGLFQYGGMPVGVNGLPAPFTGTSWFVDPVYGADGNSGLAPNRAFATLYQAVNKAKSGNNDVVYLISDGTSGSSARLSLALAQSITPSATVGTLLWNKNALHLVGVCSGSNNPRARMAPPTGTYLESTFASPNFVTVSGAGCFFYNISAYHGFSTGAAGMICWTDTGQRNTYVNCAFQGMNDTTSAASATSRSLVVGSAGNGENRFVRCIIGDDTTPRTAANASLELTGGTPRNSFEDCIFPSNDHDAGGCLTILGTGTSCIDRWNQFVRCTFVNVIKSGATTSTVLASLGSASPGGLLIFKDCDTIGFTKIGDANALANSYVSNVGGAATGGLDVNPS